ncbi:MAG: PilN domain-containing protein [Bacteroidota bacterium]
MFGNKDYIGLALQDDYIRVAKLRVTGKSVKLVKLDRYSLVEKLKSDASKEGKGGDTDDADAIFGFEEAEQEDEGGELDDLDDLDDDLGGGLDDLDLDDFEDEEEDEDAFSIGEEDLSMDMVEESDTPQSNELLLFNLLSDFEDQKIRMGLNIPAGDAIFQIIRETDFNEVKRKDLISDIEEKLESIYGTSNSSDNYDYEIREDGSLFLGSAEDDSVTLQLVNRTLELYSGKLIIEDIIPDEMILVGLVRINYELHPDEITGIIQFGKESCRVVFMKGEEVWLVSPIINEGTEKKSFMNTVFSKILFQLDTGEVPNLDRIILANNTIGDEALDFFRDNFPDIDVENLTFDEELFDYQNVDPESVPRFSTAIGSALSASGLYDDVFPDLTFLPKYVEDRQKIFKLQWHGIAILVLIFLTPITFNYFYQQNVQKIDDLSSDIDQLNANIERVTPIVEETQALEEKIAGLTSQLELLNELSENSREWSTKLTILNEGIDGVNNSWITSMSQSDGNVTLQGYTLYRDRIPDIVNIFEEATLMNVNNEELREERVYRFNITVDKFAKSDDAYSPPQPEEVKELLAGN